MRYVIVSFFLFCMAGVSAQKINKDYSFLPQEGGNLYFIMPQKGFRTDDKLAKKDLVYDITYLCSQDSATVNYTYKYSTTFITDSLYVLDDAGQRLYDVKNTMLYTQPKGSRWEHRGTFKVPYPLLQTFYKSASPIQIVLIGKSGRHIVYTMKPSKWSKQAALIRNIFTVIDLNN